MPRLPRAPLVLAILAAASLAPGVVAAPRVPASIQGIGAVTTFQVFAEGLALEGGGYDWTLVCGPCDVRFATTDAAYDVIDATSSEGPARTLPPGLYELRDYRGLFAFNVEGPSTFIVEIHGLAKVVELR